LFVYKFEVIKLKLSGAVTLQVSKMDCCIIQNSIQDSIRICCL